MLYPIRTLGGIKRFVSIISISFKCECRIIMQIQDTKNLIPGRFELGTTLSYKNRSIDNKANYKILFTINFA